MFSLRKMMDIKWLICLLIAYSALIDCQYTNKPAKFLYSKCTQNASDVTCEALNLTKERREKKSLWPAGPYAIPVKHLGCPESRSKGWSTGFILLKSWNGSIGLDKNDTEETSINLINGNSLYLQNDLKLNYCVKRQRSRDLDSGNWIPGNYNIYMSGNACPEGFTAFNRTLIIAEHTVHGEVPRFSLGKSLDMNYINLTMCDRDVLSKDEENTTQDFSMLETIFSLEKKQNYSCPLFNGAMATEERLFDDLENKICVYTPAKSKCKYGNSDLVFLIDSSTSITAENYEKLMEFIKYFLKNSDIDSGSVRVGVLIFSTAVEIQFHLNQYSRKSEVFAAIDRIPYIYGSTNTADALEMMQSVMFTQKYGDRPNVPNTCILITDGLSNINSRRTIPEAESAKKRNIHIYAVGIDLADTRELDAIASVPASENSFNIRNFDFDELRGLNQKIFRVLCPKLISPFNISRGSFSDKVIQRSIGASADWKKTDTFLIWFQLDLLRTLAVKIIIFDLNRVTHVDLIFHCYFGDEQWSFLRQDAKTCDVKTTLTVQILRFLMSNVRGRYITFVSDSDIMFSTMKENVTVLVSDTETYGEFCNEDLGMIDESIQDYQITASTWLNHHLPSYARPFSTGWCARTSDEMPWILVDLIAMTTLEGVVFYDSGSTSFILYFGTTLDNLQIFNETTLSQGQEERTLSLLKPIKVRYIKLMILNLEAKKNCLRFELRGCKVAAVPSIRCPDDSQMIDLQSGIRTGKKAYISGTKSTEECNSICLTSANCTIANYIEEVGCFHFDATIYENWQVDAKNTGITSAKLCVTDMFEMFPSFVDHGVVLANIEVILSAPSLITTIGYPFSYGVGQHYKWIVKFPEQSYIKMIFTNMALTFEDIPPNPSDKLYISNDIKDDNAGITIDNTFNDRTFVIETSESLLFLTFSSSLSQTAISPRGFRAIITKEEIPACLTIELVSQRRSECRDELCYKPKMFLTSMSLLNLPFLKDERWIIIAGKHHSVRIEILDFYVICATAPGELRSTFRLADFPDNRLYCNTIRPPTIIQSNNSIVLIIFRKYNDSLQPMIQREGFRLKYEIINHEFRDVTFLDDQKRVLEVCSKSFKKCYSIHNDTLSWKQSEHRCWVKKQSLVSVQSRNELRFIHYLLREKRYREGYTATGKLSYGPRYFAHIGLSRVGVKQTQKKFVWTNSVPLTFSAWVPGHPTNADCTRTNFHPFNADNTWESEGCFDDDLAQYFICEDEIDDSGLSNKNDDSDICGIDISLYRTVNVTYSGKECQSWDSLTSDAIRNFEKRFTVDIPLPTIASNICQDPSSSGVPWCYTFEPMILWEPCLLQQPKRLEDVDNTRNLSNGVLYRCDDGIDIPELNRCDGVFDCQDYSDETLCIDVIKNHMMLENVVENVTQPFPTNLEKGSYFRCGTKEWISIIATCDGFIDCLDASDELNCNHSQGKCNDNEFTCTDGRCIHLSQVCDLIADCENAEDELCEQTNCGIDKFLCENTQCIPNSKRCNGVPDCTDRSDEIACESCKDSFHCDINKCIETRLECDGFIDCLDESDEKSCFHDGISSCSEWWKLGYQKSGVYNIDGFTAYCDFPSLNTKFKMIIHDIDATLSHRREVTFYTRSAEEPKMSRLDTDHIFIKNSECIFQVKEDCHLPEAEASIFDGYDKGDVYEQCVCKISQFKIYRLKETYFDFYQRLHFKYCDGGNTSNETMSVLNVHIKYRDIIVDERLIEKTIPVGISVGPLTCNYESEGYLESDSFYCERERKSIPKSARCLYDTDASGGTIGCRSGSHLQNCGNFTCPRDTVKCPGSYCIPLRFLCDGIYQCPRGEDEKDCTCTDFGKEIVILSEKRLHQSGEKEVADSLARQLYTSGSIIRILHFKVHQKMKGYPLDIKMLEINEQQIYLNRAIQGNHKCTYTSMARNILQSIQFSKRNLKGIIFIEDSVVSESVAKIIFSNLSKPAFPIYRIYKFADAVSQRTHTYNHVKNVPIKKWNSLLSQGYKAFPEICKAGVQVPCAERYRCLSSKQCLPLEQVCDGVIQCLNGDDERLCNFKCPSKCKCIGHVINCRAVSFPYSEIRNLSLNTRSIDLSQNPSLRDILNQNKLQFPSMIKLNVSYCEIKRVINKAFFQLYNLRILDLGYNKLRKLPENLFSKLEHLIELNLEGNSELKEIASSAFHGLRSIRSLRITGTNLRTIASFTFSGLRLQDINISNNKIEEIENNAFNNISVRYLDFTGNNIYRFNKLIFNNVSSLLELRTPTFKFCCIRPCYVNENDCYPAKNEFSSCGDLMRHPVLQATLWIVGMAALFGNLGSIVYRLVYDRERLKIGYGIFVTNLAAADFLMGVYLIIIATMDSLYRKRYIFMDNQWRNSNLCVAAGLLSTVSSEASVLFLCLITLDRLLVIKYPFGTFKFGPKGAYISCCISWIIAFTLALIPVFYTSVFENKFYSRSGVCIALPLTKDKPPGWMYSVLIFVGLNFCTLVLVAVGQLFIFLELRKTQGKLKKTQKARKRDLQVARNLILVATTDFLCWFPIGLMGIMALNGYTISGDVYAWTAVFILPFNSALNPVLYTLTAIVGKQSFNPSTEEQSRVDTRREYGSVVLQYQNMCNNVCLKRGVVSLIDARSIGDILQKDAGKLSVQLIAVIASQLSNFLQVLHESSIALKEIHETNVFIKFDQKKTIYIIIDSMTILDEDNRQMQHNMYQYGILLRKMIAKCKKNI